MPERLVSNQSLPLASAGTPLVSVGTQWVVDASGCDPKKLQSLETIGSICRRVIDSLALTVIGDPASHRFAAPHGVTMLYLLSESHLAVHTYPEHGLATFNFVCCRDEAEWPWKAELGTSLGADDVCIRVLQRGTWHHHRERESDNASVMEALQ
ncbi:MAG: S-adenosylmethionine decarboxylase family protein [Rhodopirellula sp. JB044]|uniref:S-adenosylmethionine decarboxylase family protein n=1 Tax=Rhodopirellula sp. JB044 TaxID=3342844 RepID=UPI00370CC457